MKTKEMAYVVRFDERVGLWSQIYKHFFHRDISQFDAPLSKLALGRPEFSNIIVAGVVPLPEVVSVARCVFNADSFFENIDRMRSDRSTDRGPYVAHHNGLSEKKLYAGCSPETVRFAIKESDVTGATLEEALLILLKAKYYGTKSIIDGGNRIVCVGTRNFFNFGETPIIEIGKEGKMLFNLRYFSTAFVGKRDGVDMRQIPLLVVPSFLGEEDIRYGIG